MSDLIEEVKRHKYRIEVISERLGKDILIGKDLKEKYEKKISKPLFRNDPFMVTLNSYVEWLENKDKVNIHFFEKFKKVIDKLNSAFLEEIKDVRPESRILTRSLPEIAINSQQEIKKKDTRPRDARGRILSHKQATQKEHINTQPPSTNNNRIHEPISPLQPIQKTSPETPPNTHHISINTDYISKDTHYISNNTQGISTNTAIVSKDTVIVSKDKSSITREAVKKHFIEKYKNDPEGLREILNVKDKFKSYGLTKDDWKELESLTQ